MSNSKGVFERARQRWHIGTIFMCRKLGRGASRALQVAGLLREYASREKFFEPNGGLVTFTGLDFLAILCGANEKTIRRAMADLEKIGAVKTQHRFENSNLYWLTTTPDAQTHLAKCDRLIEERRKARKKRRSQVSGQEGQIGAETGGSKSRMNGHEQSGQADTNCPEADTNCPETAPKCPTNLDLNLDSEPFTKWCDEGSHLSKDQKEKKEGMAEKGRQQERDPLRSDDSFSPLGSAIPGADPSRSGLYLHGRRLLGERACTVIAMAEQRGVPTDEIRGSIDCVINEGGDVNDLAGLLLHGGEYW